ncbi:MAG: DEAD/DEAH box helicase [Actinomycetota bacterium]
MTLDVFSPAVRSWFNATCAEPTPAHRDGWAAIARGDHTLVLAPTGSGKTLAAFLWAIDRLAAEPAPPPGGRTRVLYISPLRALAVDVEKNLRTPLGGIQLAAERLGETLPHLPDVGVRTGDTPAADRRRQLRSPPDILITTPESLYLMLTSAARETLRSVRWVIVDEIHSLAATKRGAHLALSLERLEELAERPPQRIGLSATQRPLDVIARFLGGRTAEGRRPVTIVDAGHRKPMEIEIVVPVEDLSEVGRAAEPSLREGGRGPEQASIWPSIHPRLVELIRAHRSTIVFANARRLAERLAAHLNELAGEDLVRAHHGSLAREQRLEVEDGLKTGRLRGIVATSSLELGIDMGAVDLVIQVESPGSVASGLQRIGRAGHRVGEPSKGKIFPKFRGDLLEAAVVTERMLAGLIEETRYPRNPLDVLAQQLVAMCAVGPWSVPALRDVVRRAANFEDLSDEVFLAVLDMLAGRYPSDGFSGLRPRVVWDRATDTVRARDGAGSLAITNGGTIPDRGLFGVFLPDGTRVGELDEEMVYESRVGEVFLLGASAWRIQEITRDRVVVTPAPGELGKMPFWHGDKPGRPLELGRALGAFTRELAAAEPPAAVERLRREAGLDPLAAANLVAYIDDQREATGVLPDDRTIVVERFRDEVGDWRLCVLSPFGSRVHAPWALAIEARLVERLGPGGQVLWSDDGIVIRLPEAEERIPLEDLLFEPDEVEDAVVAALPRTAMFASAFREAAARALLLPRRRPGQRTPLWQQRQRAADLLAEAAKHPTFPILLEATRECLRDVFDVPALREVMAGLRSRRTKLVTVETEHASPFAQSLLFRWIAVYMYEGDAPLAERRAAALALDRDLLRELLGAEELRELLDPRALDEVELELQRLAPGRGARGADGAHDLLRELGPLSDDELRARLAGGPADAVDAIERVLDDGRAIAIRLAGEDRLAAVEDAARLRDALGVALPPGIPAAFREPAPSPLEDMVARYARTHGPFLADEAAARLGIGAGRVREARRTRGGRPGRERGVPSGRRRAGVVRHGRPAPPAALLAALRREIEPVDGPALGRFLPAWQGADHPGGGGDALVEALGGSRARRSPPRSSRPTCCRRASAATGRRTSTPCARAGVGLDRRRRARRRRRPRVAVLPRPRAPAGSGPGGRASVRGAPRLAAGAPGRARRLVLARPRPGGRHGRRTGGAACPVGPGLGRRGHERHPHAAARRRGSRAVPPAACERPATTWGAQAGGTARGRRALVPRVLAPGAGRHADRDRPRSRDAAPRPVRGRDPRGRPLRGDPRRVRRGLRGAPRDGVLGGGPARLLRRRARRGSVRAPGGGGSPTDAARAGAGPGRRARPRRRRPRTTLRRGAPVARRSGTAVPERRRHGRAGGRRARRLPGARRTAAADVRGAARGLGRRARGLVKDGRLRRIELTAVDGVPPTTRLWRRRCAGPGSSTATAASPSAPDAPGIRRRGGTLPPGTRRGPTCQTPPRDGRAARGEARWS